MFFDWKDEYLVNVPEIDAQHQKLFMMVKVMHGYVESQGSHIIMKNFLNEIIKYTETHFAYEEEYIASLDCPPQYLEEEKMAHRHLIEQVKGFSREYEKTNSVFTIELIRFFVDWLANHIVRFDSEMATCFVGV